MRTELAALRDRTLEGHESARKRGKTVGGASVTDEDMLSMALHLRDRARGIDPRTITAHRMPESTSAHTAFRRDETDAASVRAAVLDLAATVGERIRRRDQVGPQGHPHRGTRRRGERLADPGHCRPRPGTPRTWAVRRTGSSTDWRSSVPGSGGSS
ncbi:DinB/UmuC family translesion DNA polymerase [Streptomyces hydrogenans]|uniref:DinB/UmuC family translesion DNA polymerase n=1 Tax=Streptomyces hydrogenans TaxID=1873719 RepID=UPI0035DFCC93